MKKPVILTLLLAILLLPQLGHTAGGILRNGELLTIGSSGLQVSLKSLTAAELPELASVVQGVKQFVLPIEILGTIQKQFRPSPSRGFFKVNKLSQEEERMLVEEYRKIFPELPESDRLTLFAFTDKEKGETYLLPAFFQLTNTQRAAVLFNEGVVASGLVTSREKLVALEAQFEAALKCASNCGAVWDDLQISLTTSLSYDSSIRVFLMMMQRAALQDAAAGQLTGILGKNGDMNLAALLGPELLGMMVADLQQAHGTTNSPFSVEYREARMAELAEKWPDSRFLRILLNCPYQFTFVRHLVETKTVYSSNMVTKPNDPRITSIANWQYKELLIKFSQKTLTYAPEVSAYYLTGIGERRDSEDVAAVKRAILLAVQPIDTAQVTSLRKAYILRESNRSDGGYWGGGEDRSWEYYYYVYGLALQ